MTSARPARLDPAPKRISSPTPQPASGPSLKAASGPSLKAASGRSRNLPQARPLDDLVVRQHGVVARAQLLELGLSPGVIDRQIRSGWLRPLLRGIYQVGPVPPALALETAAALAGGPEGALSHTSALALWKLKTRRNGEPIHVTIAGSSRVNTRTVLFHRTKTWRDDERTVVDGIPVTSVARTLVDVASILGSREFSHVISSAERLELLSQPQLARLPGRYARRAGMALVRTLVESSCDRPFLRSEAERRCVALLVEAGIQRPEVNVSVGPYELDLFWPKEGVAIEVDGYRHHRSRAQFESDRGKDMWLRSKGIEVIRLTWRQITQTPLATAVMVGQGLVLARDRRARAEGRMPWADLATERSAHTPEPKEIGGVIGTAPR